MGKGIRRGSRPARILAVGPLAPALLALLVTGCCRVESCRCAESVDGPPPAAEAVAEPQPAVVRGAVYLDLSQTMRGFIADRDHELPFTHLQALLRGLLVQTFRGVDLDPPVVRGFGRDLVREMSPLEDYAGLTPLRSARPLFDQGQTDVVGALERAARSPDTLSVVVTDNGQDLRRSGGGRVPGFDRASFVQVLTDGLAAEGFGVWLVGVQDDFFGDYYSILPVFDRGVRVNRPLPLRGRRPVYCWVLSRDVLRGRAFVGALLDNLRAHGEGAADGAERVQAVELAPGVRPGVELEEDLEPRPAPGRAAGYPVRRPFRVRSWNPSPIATFACLGFERSRQSQPHAVRVRGRLVADPARAGLEGLRLPDEVWAIGVRMVDERGDVRLGEGDERATLLTLRPSVLAALPAADRHLDLELRVSARLDRLPADSWIAAWSTRDDTTPEAIEGRTLYLHEVVGDVLESTVGQPRPRLRVRLCFAPLC